MTESKSDVYAAPIRVGEIFADPTYQRILDVARARKMASAWDRRLAGIVEVADRGENCNPRYAVIDGQHRWAAAKFLKDPPMLVANVHEGLTLAQEAELFDKLNRQRRQPSTWDHWKARRAAGDETVLAIEAVVAKHGLEVHMAPSDGYIRCTGTLERVEKISLTLLDETLAMIVAVWQDRRDGLDAPIVHGLALILHYLRDQIDHQRLVDALADVMPRQIRMQANSLRDMQPGNLYTLAAIVMMGLYNKRPGRRIEVTNKTFGGSGTNNAAPKPKGAAKSPVTMRQERRKEREVAELETVSHSREHTLSVPSGLPPQRAYTEEQAEAVERLNGKTAIEIATELGISARTVRIIRSDLGLDEAAS